MSNSMFPCTIRTRWIKHSSGAFDGKAYERMKQAVLEEKRRHFRPAFLNRVDDIVVFHALSEAHLKQIIEIQLVYLRKRLAERDDTHTRLVAWYTLPVR